MVIAQNGTIEVRGVPGGGAGMTIGFVVESATKQLTKKVANPASGISAKMTKTPTARFTTFPVVSRSIARGVS